MYAAASAWAWSEAGRGKIANKHNSPDWLERGVRSLSKPSEPESTDLDTDRLQSTSLQPLRLVSRLRLSIFGSPGFPTSDSYCKTICSPKTSYGNPHVCGRKRLLCTKSLHPSPAQNQGSVSDHVATNAEGPTGGCLENMLSRRFCLWLLQHA